MLVVKEGPLPDHSLNRLSLLRFDIRLTAQVEVYILLLHGPVGFENPFLESLLPSCVVYSNKFLDINKKAKVRVLSRMTLVASHSSGVVVISLQPVIAIMTTDNRNDV